MIKLLLGKQIFASSDARLCHDMHNDGRNPQNFVCKHAILALMWFVSLVCVYGPKWGLEEPQGVTLPMHEKIN